MLAIKRKTVDEIMSCQPCYTREKVTELWAGKDALSGLEILNLDIPDVDKIWGLTRCELLTHKQKVAFACDCAESVLHLYVEKSDAPSNAIKTARAWLQGNATTEECKTAYAAASDAAYAAADAAADAAYAAADAADAAAYAAASDAYAAAATTYTAAATATYAAAADAAAATTYTAAAADAAASDERKKQVGFLRNILNQEDTPC